MFKLPAVCILVSYWVTNTDSPPAGVELFLLTQVQNECSSWAFGLCSLFSRRRSSRQALNLNWPKMSVKQNFFKFYKCIWRWILNTRLHTSTRREWRFAGLGFTELWEKWWNVETSQHISKRNDGRWKLWLTAMKVRIDEVVKQPFSKKYVATDVSV